MESLSIVEQLARMGADDVLFSSINRDEFLRKIVLFARNTKSNSSSELIIVDSGKGAREILIKPVDLDDLCRSIELCAQPQKSDQVHSVVGGTQSEQLY